MEQNENKKNEGSRFGLGVGIGVLITLAVVLLLAVGAVVLVMRGTLHLGKTELTSREKLETIQSYLDSYALHEVDEEAISDAMADGFLSSIGDPYAKYYTKEEFSQMMEERSGVYSGIGVSVIWKEEEGVAEVVRIFEGSPAEEAGMKKEDLIVEADGQRNFADLDALVTAVRGEAGTEVKLILSRKGKEIPLTVERRSIDMQTVEYKLRDDKIGYIQLKEFDSITVEQFNNALDDLEKQGAKALILDLRDNPGGDYDTVMKMADRVLPEGTIAQINNRQGTVKTEESDEEHKVTLPMAVLINGGSASASELFTGAIRDYGIATIIGTTSYGKGVIQSIFRLPDGSGMKFTTEEYLTPNGGHIDGIGITPDIEVEIPEAAYEDGIVTEEEDTQLQKAVEVLTNGTGETVRK